MAESLIRAVNPVQRSTLAVVRAKDPGSADCSVRLPELAREVATCTKCPLYATRTQTVFARGNPEAALCFVGEAPGADEDEQGLPFVGRAGSFSIG